MDGRRRLESGLPDGAQGDVELGGGVPRVLLTSLTWQIADATQRGAIPMTISGALINGVARRDFSCQVVIDD